MGLIQRRQLRTYLYFRGRAMTVTSLIRLNWQMLVLTNGIGIVASTGLCLAGECLLAWLIVAALVVVASRDLGYFIRFSRAWPMTRSLLNWSAVAALAAEHGIAA